MLNKRAKREGKHHIAAPGEGTESVVAPLRGDCCDFTSAGDLINFAVNTRRLTAFFQLSSINVQRDSWNISC